VAPRPERPQLAAIRHMRMPHLGSTDLDILRRQLEAVTAAARGVLVVRWGLGWPSIGVSA
jgi:hypothetical protein